MKGLRMFRTLLSLALAIKEVAYEFAIVNYYISSE